MSSDIFGVQCLLICKCWSAAVITYLLQPKSIREALSTYILRSLDLQPALEPNMKTCLSLAILLHCAITVLCRSSGAPPEACATLVPQHGFNPINPADSPPPYYIVSSQLPILNGNYMYRAGETYDSTWNYNYTKLSQAFHLLYMVDQY